MEYVCGSGEVLEGSLLVVKVKVYSWYYGVPEKSWREKTSTGGTKRLEEYGRKCTGKVFMEEKTLCGKGVDIYGESMGRRVLVGG